MTRLNGLLLIVLMVCAIALVTSQHRARKLFIELESQQTLAKKLDEEYSQLKLEQSTWASPKRTEDIAAKSIGMRLPNASNTVVLKEGDAPQSAAGERK